jgi:Raf kinase inhibitor-like YbhB/YbcL family protein
MTDTPRRPPLPYEFLPPVPSLTVNSDDITDGEVFSDTHIAGATMGMSGGNLSPHLRWDEGLDGTQSYAVTCFDPDAPTGSGFWHWVMFDIPGSVTELPRGAGSGSMEGKPDAALHARNDTGGLGYIGAAPPPGHGDHRYVFCVHAVGIPTLGLDQTATPAYVGFNLTFNSLARGLIIAVYGR